VGTPPRAALQVAYALGAQAGARGQIFLRKTCGFPLSPQPRAERGVLPSSHVARPSLLMNLRTFPRTKNGSRRRELLVRSAGTPTVQLQE